MSSYGLGFQDVDRTRILVVGGKGANLGELSRIEGLRVPEGFCVSTEAYRRIIEATPPLSERFDRLTRLEATDRKEIRELSGEIRRVIEGTPLPEDLVEEVTRLLSRLGDDHAYAVRSSATAEDMLTASFAGQHETYLNITGAKAILEHISKCWASLFTERAVTYRLQNGIDHRNVRQAVVIQKMILPQAAGILFTADPVTSNRKVTSIDASFGLAEALVSGLVNADLYKVRDGQVIEKTIATKQLALQARNQGGTEEQEIAPERQNRPALTDEQIVELEHLGRRIESHFGHPQDIEWCLADEAFYIVQSRPITTLFPVPEAHDQDPHVYVSVGHQQMMTDPMKPLGISLFQLTALRPMYKAGGRLFVDIASNLASPASRAMLLDGMGQHDPLIKDALMTVIARGDLIGPSPDDNQPLIPANGNPGTSSEGFQSPIENDPAIVSGLIQASHASIEELKNVIQGRSGSELFDFIREDLQHLRTSMFDPRSMAVITMAQNASRWLNERIESWLGEKNAADALTQSVPNNITSEMGLELLDVADVIRPHPEVVAYLQTVQDDGFLEDLIEFEGGREARDAIRTYLDRYGMRCVGEIDITRPRWSERPSTLVPLILNNVKNFEPGASRRKFEQGRQGALKKEGELLERLLQLPEGTEKARETKRVIDLVRNFIGYREFPKYRLINRYFVYKQALLKEAESLLRAGVIREIEDIDYLTFEELHEVARTHTLDDLLISQRKAEHALHEKMTPPRVMTSEGEIFAGEYKRENLPAGALVGLPVSAGVIEGRARVILTIEGAELEEGDILVTPFTDPSWTPLFVSIGGLVTEVGGLMTHGAVIAREYGLPAVVGVEHATRLIKDGQRIRVHGTEGFVEIL